MFFPCLGPRDKFQIFALINLVCRNKCSPEEHRVENPHAAPKLLDIPRCFWIIQVTCHQLHLRRISMEKDVVTFSYLLARSILQYNDCHLPPARHFEHNWNFLPSMSRMAICRLFKD